MAEEYRKVGWTDDSEPDIDEYNLDHMDEQILQNDKRLTNIERHGVAGIIPNPPMEGDEEALNGLQIGDDKYKIVGGGGGDVPSTTVLWANEEKILPRGHVVKSPFDFAINEDGVYGYIRREADTDVFVPFSSGGGEGGIFKRGALIFDDYVSRGNQYLYPNVLVTPLTYDYFVAYVYVDGILYTSLDIKLHTDHVELHLDSHLGKRTLHIHVNSQQVTSVQYSGDWKDIKVALYGVEINEEYEDKALEYINRQSGTTSQSFSVESLKEIYITANNGNQLVALAKYYVDGDLLVDAGKEAFAQAYIAGNKHLKDMYSSTYYVQVVTRKRADKSWYFTWSLGSDYGTVDVSYNNGILTVNNSYYTLSSDIYKEKK